MPQPNKEALREARKERGRPKEFDRHIIIQQMNDWAAKSDSITFAEFCAEHCYTPQLIWRLAQQYEDFEDAYTIVKMKLTGRREKLMNQNLLNYGSWARYVKALDPFLDKFEEDDKDKDVMRKKDIAATEQKNLLLLAQMAAEGKISQK